MASSSLINKSGNNDDGGPFFGLLPDELVLKILSLLPLSDLALGGLMNVGDRRIAKICQDESMWTHVRVSKDWDTYTVCRILSAAGGKLKRLTLAPTSDGEDEGEDRALAIMALAIMALANNPRLEILEFNQEVFSVKMMKAIGKSSVLRKITVTARRRSSYYWRTMADDLSANVSFLKHLTDIDLWDLFVVPGNGGADWVLTLADNCRRLESVSLPDSIGGVLSDKVFNEFLEKTRRTLKGLVLSGDLLTDASVCNLTHCDKLERLVLFRAAHVGKEGLHILAWLSSTRLTMLGISDVSGQDLVEAFAGRGMSSASLTMLILMRCRELDDIRLGTIVRSCPDLTNLQVTECEGVGDAGIGAVLNLCKKLKYLCLGSTGMTAEGFAGSYVSSESNLKELQVDDQQLVTKIRKILPRLYVV